MFRFQKIFKENNIFVFRVLEEVGRFFYASKVSNRFEFFQSGFASEVVLILETVVLNAEFYSLSNGIIFEGGHRAKNATF